MNTQPTNQEILEAINTFASNVQSEFHKIESSMVTKDYFEEKLTDKLADLRGDIVVLVRKEDRKFGALIEELLKRQLIDQEAAKRILSMEPFPQMG